MWAGYVIITDITQPRSGADKVSIHLINRMLEEHTMTLTLMAAIFQSGHQNLHVSISQFLICIEKKLVSEYTFQDPKLQKEQSQNNT